MNLPRSERLIAHLDMNSFFARVEQQAQRNLRGRPVGVCAYLGQHGCVIAASVEAKQCGVKVGMTVQMAKQHAPNMAFVQADPAKYRSVISRVFPLLHELTDRVEHYSIDEAFLDLTGWYQDDLSLMRPFLQVKQRIRDEIGEWLSCSVGIGPTRLLAKMASDHAKPNGFTMVSHDSARSFLAMHELTDVCGIGERTRRRLNRVGINTILEFVDYPTANILRVGGKGLYFLQAGLRGLNTDLVKPFSQEAPKSVGHSYCVPRQVNRDGLVLPVFMKLVEKASYRLRQLEKCAQGIHVAVGLQKEPRTVGAYRRFELVESAFRHLSEPQADRFSLLDAALKLLASLWDGAREVTFLAITLTDLTVPTTQGIMCHADKTERPERNQRLSKAVDQLRGKYGGQAIVIGKMAQLKEEAPDRIGFRKTEGIDIILSA